MNKRILYLECYSGISGDMTVAALLDLGADQKGLLQMLQSMPLSGYRVEIGRREKAGILACDFDVIMEEEQHVHRHLEEINRIIEETKADDRVKALAKKMFQIVAEAEAVAHNVPVEQVHFHEVGAVDSIVDIMSAAYCIVSLNADTAVVSDLFEGQGYVKCQHGLLPVPVPAVLNTVQSHGLRLHLTKNEGEMITPTGAAIAAVLNQEERLPETYRILRTGLGAGKKEFPHANILRAMLLEEAAQETEEKLWVLETNLDDCTGEALGFVIEMLMEAGARDVTYTPIYMKKNRPAWMLGVLSDEAHRETMERLIFTHTTTIGIRKYPVMRRTLKRRTIKITTSLGEAQVKEIQHPEGIRWTPEYESVRTLCKCTGEGFQKVYETVQKEASEALRGAKDPWIQH